MKLVILVVVSVVAVVNSQSLTACGNCTNYGAPCNPLNQTSCCMFPLVFCLPNITGGSSCMAPTDFNIAPNLTIYSTYADIVNNFQNATMTLLGLASSFNFATG